jgi:hypothetical protein
MGVFYFYIMKKIKKFYRQHYSIQDIKDFIRNNKIVEYSIHRSSLYYELEYKRK